MWGSRRSFRSDSSGATEPKTPTRTSADRTKDYYITREGLGYELRLAMREVEDHLGARVRQELAPTLHQLRDEVRQLKEQQTRATAMSGDMRRMSSWTTVNKRRSVFPEEHPLADRELPDDWKGDGGMMESLLSLGRASSRRPTARAPPAAQDDGMAPLISIAASSARPNTAEGSPPSPALPEAALMRMDSKETETRSGARSGKSVSSKEEEKIDWQALVRTRTISNMDTANCCARFVRSPTFDAAMGVLIVANAISIGIQTEYMAQNMSLFAPVQFELVEVAFAVLFTIEVFLRIWAYGGIHYFRMPTWRWNVLDCCLIGLQVSELMLRHMFDAGASGAVNVVPLRLLRALRLVRIVRLVRVLRLLEELRRVWFSFAASLRPFCVAFAILMIIVYISGIYLTQLVLDHRLASKDAAGPAPEALGQYFGGVGRTVLTLFESVSGGLSWDSAITPLMGEVSPWVGVAYSGFITLAAFAIGNIITAAFVESFSENAREAKDLHTLSHIRELFDEADISGTGIVGWAEFQEQLMEDRTQELLRELDLQSSDAEGMFRLLDIKGDGELNMEDFCRGCLRLRAAAKALDVGELKHSIQILVDSFCIFSSSVESQLAELSRSVEAAEPSRTRELSSPKIRTPGSRRRSAASASSSGGGSAGGSEEGPSRGG